METIEIKDRGDGETMQKDSANNVQVLDFKPNVNYWFELSYAQYLTVPRSILEAMPQEWQERFAACLFELDAEFDWRPKAGRYWCRLKDDRGRFTDDPLMQYRHPNFEYIESLRKKDPD